MSAPVSAPAQQYGDYRLVDGAPPKEGSTGLLYEALHVRTGAPALVKVLRPQWSNNPTLRRRFREEGEAAVGIRHPGVVKVLDAGEREAEPYLVLEKLDGQNLREAMKRARPPDATHVARQLARALVAVHDAGVVHRDLKPENLFLVPDATVEGGERVIILDFGIAKPRARSDAFATQQGAQFGTEPYMAPEQWSDPSLADARTDLYAVGCVLFELVVGEPPFGVFGNLGEAHARQPVPPLPPSTPPTIARVIRRLLEKDPSARYASAGALLVALDDDHSSTAIRVAPGPASTSRVTPKLAAAIGIVLGIVIGAGAMWITLHTLSAR